MADNKNEGLDFLTRLRIKELVLFGLILISAVIANLPDEYVAETLGMDRGMLVACLGIAVIIGLFLYLRTGLFISVVLLIAGANMPDQIAEGSTSPRSRSSGAGRAGRRRRGQPHRQAHADRARAQAEGEERRGHPLFYAIEKNNLVYAAKVLSMNFDPNLRHDNGYTPLAYARCAAACR